MDLLLVKHNQYPALCRNYIFNLPRLIQNKHCFSLRRTSSSNPVCLWSILGAVSVQYMHELIFISDLNEYSINATKDSLETIIVQYK